MKAAAVGTVEGERDALVGEGWFGHSVYQCSTRVSHEPLPSGRRFQHPPI